MQEDWVREVQKAVKEGNIDIGLRKVKKSLKKGMGKLLVVASSCPEKDVLLYYAKLNNIDAIAYEGNGYELGAIVKKPFSVSAVLVK